MGLHGGPPKALILALRNEFSVDRFLETGTYRGATAIWAAQHFGKVVTIEASEQLHRQAVARHGHHRNARFVLGDTRSVLRAEAEALGGPAIVWLDSHWSGGGTFGEDDECPLLLEIETLRASTDAHYLFIDDARLFVAPPPMPHKMDQWPTLTQVTAALTSGDRPLEVLVLDDAFVAVPAAARLLVWQFAQAAATQVWEQRHTPAGQPLVTIAAQRLLAHARSLKGRIGKRT